MVIEATRKFRKKCDACGRPIMKGEACAYMKRGDKPVNVHIKCPEELDDEG